MKSSPKTGRSARRGNNPSPYTKRAKTPYPFRHEGTLEDGRPKSNVRLMSGELKTPAKQHPSNKYA